MTTLAALYARCLSYRKVRSLCASLLALAACVGWLRPRPLAALGWVLGGAAFWMVFEYFLHRYALHAPRVPARYPRLRRAHDAMHRDHHLAPDDPDQLFISEKGTLALLALTALAGAAAGGPVGAAGLALGFGLAMAQYGVAHLAAHSDYAPRTRYGRMMKEGHLLHHQRSARGWFGVLTPFVDHLAGTWGPPRR